MSPDLPSITYQAIQALSHPFNPSTSEADKSLSLRLVLQSEFQNNQGYAEKPCLKQTNKKNQNKTKLKGKKVGMTAMGRQRRTLGQPKLRPIY